MARMAVINAKTGTIENIIVANRGDKAPNGCVLSAAPDNVDQRWHWDGESGFMPGHDLIKEQASHRLEFDHETKEFKPNAELAAEMEAERAAAEKQAP